jgi:hypothetical protein
MFQISYPSSKYLRKLFRDYPDDGYTALSAKMDADLLKMRQEIIELYYLKDSSRCIASLLDELGYYVSAGLFDSDTETQKRKKIYTAIVTQKTRSSFTYHAKPVMDAITGYDARILNTRAYKMTLNSWVECDGVNNVGTMWAPEGDGTDPTFLGIRESCPGADIVPEIAGAIYIDCHFGVNTAVLSALTISQLYDFLKKEIVPAYFRCYLSYIDVSGFIQIYSGGIIN